MAKEWRVKKRSEGVDEVCGKVFTMIDSAC